MAGFVIDDATLNEWPPKGTIYFHLPPTTRKDVAAAWFLGELANIREALRWMFHEFASNREEVMARWNALAREADNLPRAKLTPKRYRKRCRAIVQRANVIFTWALNLRTTRLSETLDSFFGGRQCGRSWEDEAVARLTRTHTTTGDRQ